MVKPRLCGFLGLEQYRQLANLSVCGLWSVVCGLLITFVNVSHALFRFRQYQAKGCSLPQQSNAGGDYIGE